MRASLLISVLTMGLATSACGRSQTAPEFGQTDINAINALVQEFTSVYNAKDAVKVANLFTGAAVVMPPNASTVRGNENVREYYVNRFKMGATDLNIETRDVAGAGPLAYVSGDYRLNMAPPDGPERRDRGKFLFILREANERWLLEYLMFSSDFAPVAPES